MRLAPLLLVLLLLSCAPSPDLVREERRERVNEAMQSWDGRPVADLYASWGPPSRTDPDGRGGTIVTYYIQRDGGYAPGVVVTLDDGVTAYRPARDQSYTAERNFYVRPDGIIYHWRWRGL